MKLLYQGAESKIILKQGVVEKVRIRKNYRIKQLDEKLRKLRTRREARIMREARKLGILIPKIIEVDEKNYTIKMEYVKGITVKQKLEQGYSKKICEKIGEYIAKLHANGIVHGDLTTSNMILAKQGLYLIDFGLADFSNRIEDYAQDLLVLKECLISTHPVIANKCWKTIINSYANNFDKAEQVIAKIEEIESRGRYTIRKKD